MNVVTRGIKNSFRSPMRSGAIVLMLAISIGLILSMLVARSSVDAKVEEVKATAGTNITISPAGIQGFSGGGNPLTSDQVATISSTSHISSIVSTLSDQLGTDETNLTSPIELGSFGQRQQRFNSESSTSSESTSDSSADSTTAPDDSAMPKMTPRITVTGTTDPNSVSTNGSDLEITDGSTIDGSSDNLVALIGTDLAEENDLSVGDTFTAYDKTITVSGIFETGNTFQDGGIIMPLAAVQSLTDQADAISSVIATVDSSDNVASAVSALEDALGDEVDVTSEIEQAETSVESLKSISSLALAGVIGATIAGSVIVLLSMIMVVRERRHEIGVIKAIGCSNTKVVAQFVSEALTLTIIGAVLGLALGILVSGPMTNSLVSNQTSSSLSKAQGATPQQPSSDSSTTTANMPGGMIRGGMKQISTNFTQVTSSLTPSTFIIAVGMTLLIAIIGSAIPAWSIARIRPAEVLRTE